MKTGIGIDTGGTYTDAVVYGFEGKTVLGTAKSLTTRNDLSIGILGAIDALPPGLAQQAELIALSTTLATNACVEDKGGRAKLIFFGGDERVIGELGGKYGLPPPGDIYIQESYTKFAGEAEREPNWDLFRRRLEDGFEGLDGAGIIEVYAMRNGAAVEKKAKEVFREKHDIPVVCGHELFSELNCLQRGSSTLLNAGLFPVIKEFLTAVKKALALRGIGATVVIVRSDGSLMSEDYAFLRPVETLLCGPAASAIGGTRLLENPDSVIVDMGGTTTDISLVKGGVPVTATSGVSIGKWKTYVDGLYVKTIGLGGDSAIHYHGKNLCLEDFRVTPLCIAAQEYPVIANNLKRLGKKTHTCFHHEHYMLVKGIGGSARYTDEEKAFADALEEGPLIFAEAAAAVGKEIYTLDVRRLVKDGVVQVCGLTPTDIMHINGDFGVYNAEASLLGAEYVAHNMGISVRALCDSVYDEVKRKLYLNVVAALLENKYPDYMKNGVPEEITGFIAGNYDEARAEGRDGAKPGNGLLSAMLGTGYSLVGAGAPIHIFIDDVAKMLGARSMVPEHYEVANALGAVMGSVSASCSVEVSPNIESDGPAGYTAFGNNEKRVFKEMEDAIGFAVSEAKKGAKAEAARRGASGNVAVTLDIDTHEAEAKDCVVYLGTTVTARAVGTIGFR